MSILIISFYLIILLLLKSRNIGYSFLVLLQILSLSTGFLVVHYVQFSSGLTFFNIIYVCLLLYLIITPWRHVNFERITIRNTRFFEYFRKILDKFLYISLIVNITVFTLVLIFIPDVSKLKNEHAFVELYESIPYFSILFRFSAISTDLGYFSIPISIFYYSIDDISKGKKYLLLSTSILFGALSSYSRAGILTYFLILVGFFLLNASVLDLNIKHRLYKYIKLGGLSFVSVFMMITIVRFNAMDYYADRIPQKSIIKNPIAYNIFDYASQGFFNGVNQLELHSTEDVSWGQNTFYVLNQTLSFFHIVNWSSESVFNHNDKAYNKTGLVGENDSGAFHGFSCRMVKEFGYFLSFIICLMYNIYVRKKSKLTEINLESLYWLIFLFAQSAMSIFYAKTGMLIFPLLFYGLIKILYRLTHN